MNNNTSSENTILRILDHLRVAYLRGSREEGLDKTMRSLGRTIKMDIKDLQKQAVLDVLDRIEIKDNELIPASIGAGEKIMKERIATIRKELEAGGKDGL